MDNLIKASYVLFIVSIITLFFLTRFYEPKHRTISDAKTLASESFVTINGIVKKSRVSGKNVFLELNEISSITAMGSNDPKRNYSEMIGKPVTIIGKVSEYNGEKELMIYSIK